MVPTEFHPDALKLVDLLWDKYVSPPEYVEWNRMVRFMGRHFSHILSLVDSNVGELKTAFPDHDERAFNSVLALTLSTYTTTDPASIYVKRELVEAFCMTKVPAMAAPNRVLDSFVLMLPEKSFQVENGYITSLYIVVSGLLCDDLEIHPDLEYVVCAITDRGYGLLKPLLWDREAGDLRNDRLVTLVKNVILAYNYQPEMFSETPARQVVARGSGFGKTSNPTRPPLATRWLGADYAIKKESRGPLYVTESARVCHPKRSHWRQGHWHTVCCGPGRKQRKQQWFQPVYVNAG